jgi:hypothetical protein
MRCLAVLGLAEPAELAQVLVSHGARWLKRQGVMLPVWLGEDFPRQPLAGHAGPALPCHPDEHLGDW